MKPSILFIDDDQEFLNTYSRLLGGNYNLNCFNSFAKAKLELTELMYSTDLIICDIHIGDEDGFEVFSELQKMPYISKIPFIFKTSSPNNNIFKRALSVNYIEIISTLMSNFEIEQRIVKELSKSNLFKVYVEDKLYSIICTADSKVLYPFVENENIELNKFEMKLAKFIGAKNTPRLKEDIINHIFGENYVLTDNNFNTSLSNFRKKLAPLGCSLKTIRGAGVVFC